MTSLNNVIFYSITAVFAVMAGWVVLLDTPDQMMLLSVLSLGGIALQGLLFYFVNQNHEHLCTIAVANERYEQTNTLIKTLITLNSPSNDDLALSFYRSMLGEVKTATTLTDLVKILNNDERDAIPSALQKAITRALENHSISHVMSSDARRVINRSPLLCPENIAECISHIKQLSYDLSLWLRNEMKAQDGSVS